jgi:hypothetical protein
MTPLVKGPAFRKDLYLTTNNTHNRQTSMPSAGFEPTIPVSERSYTRALDRVVNGIGKCSLRRVIFPPRLPTNVSICFSYITLHVTYLSSPILIDLLDLKYLVHFKLRCCSLCCFLHTVCILFCTCVGVLYSVDVF